MIAATKQGHPGTAGRRRAASPVPAHPAPRILRWSLRPRGAALPISDPSDPLHRPRLPSRQLSPDPVPAPAAPLGHHAQRRQGAPCQISLHQRRHNTPRQSHARSSPTARPNAAGGSSADPAWKRRCGARRAMLPSATARPAHAEAGRAALFLDAAAPVSPRAPLGAQHGTSEPHTGRPRRGRPWPGEAAQGKEPERAEAVSAGRARGSREPHVALTSPSALLFSLMTLIQASMSSRSSA